MAGDLGICLIGAGRAGLIHARNFAGRVKGARMSAIVDVNEDAARSAAKETGAERVYTHYGEALADERVQAVVVVSPTNLHRQIVVDAAAAGKHVFCEKPMAMDEAECEDMIEACRRHNVKLQIGFMRRFDESFQRAWELVESGSIGELVQIHSCTRGPSKPQPWMYDLKKSNGILAEVNSHDIDSVRWFARSEYDSLYALGGNYRNREVAGEYPDYYDSVLMNGRMKNGVQFSIDGASYIQYGYDSRMELVGNKGTIHVGRDSRDFVTAVTVGGGISRGFVDSWRDLFRDAYLQEDIAFAECVLEDKAPAVSGHDGRMAVAAVLAGNRSIASGQIVKL